MHTEKTDSESEPQFLDTHLQLDVQFFITKFTVEEKLATFHFYLEGVVGSDTIGAFIGTATHLQLGVILPLS